MKNLTISIGEDLFVEIDRRTTVDFDHNDVIEKLLKRALLPSLPNRNPRPITPAANSITSFVRTPEYSVLSGIGKYLAVLGWIYKNKPNEFRKIENFQRGNRVYFGQSQQQVEDSGKSIAAKQIPGSTVWALATLDNRAKRDLLADVLRLCDFQPGEIGTVVSAISDSGRHRRATEKTLADYA